jgi:CRISPR/Cas system CSM-associated protein Csm3 (group 7 of RAMP superfamily)
MTVSRTKIDLHFKIILNGAIAVGSGFRRGQIQRTVARGLDGLPYLPASTLKGRVRDAAERLAQNLGHDICKGPNPHHMCGATRPAAQFCLICRAFGSPGVSAMSGQTGLLWRDAKLCDSQGQPIGDVNRQEAEAYYYARTQAQLSRPRATALEKHLFTSENTLEDLCFRASIRGWLPQTATMAGQFPAELVLLLSGLKLLNFVGGGKSRGLGFCAVELPDHFELDNRNVQTAAVISEIIHLDRRKES